MPTFADAGRVIEQNLEALRKPGILGVRPGYRTEAGWPVGDPVIVALVGAKKGEAAAYGLPSQLGGVPVEVREASPLERLKATQPSVHAAVKERSRIEQHTPDFPSSIRLRRPRKLSRRRRTGRQNRKFPIARPRPRSIR